MYRLRHENQVFHAKMRCFRISVLYHKSYCFLAILTQFNILVPMKSLLTKSFTIIVCITAFIESGMCQEGSSARLIEGVKAVWDIEKAHHQSTPTRERICINGSGEPR